MNNSQNSNTSYYSNGKFDVNSYFSDKKNGTKTNSNQGSSGYFSGGKFDVNSYFTDKKNGVNTKAQSITNDDALLFNNTFGAESITEDQRNDFSYDENSVSKKSNPQIIHSGDKYIYNGTIYYTESHAIDAKNEYEQNNATVQESSVPSITQTDNGYTFNGTTYASQSLAQQAQDQWKADNNVTDEPVLTDEEKQIEANGGLTDEEQKLFNSLVEKMNSYENTTLDDPTSMNTFAMLSPEEQELYDTLTEKQIAYSAEQEVIKLDSTINEETGMTARESKVYIINYESNIGVVRAEALGEDYERYSALKEKEEAELELQQAGIQSKSLLSAEDIAFMQECEKKMNAAEDKYVEAHRSEFDLYEQCEDFWDSVKKDFHWSDKMERYCSDVVAEQEELKKEEYHQFAVENGISDEEAASVIENGEYLSEDYVKATKVLDSFDDETNKAFEDQNTKISQSMDEYDYYDSQISDLLGIGWQNMDAEDIIYAMKGMTSDQIEALQVYYFLYRESAGIINEGMNISYGDMTYGDIINGLNNPYDKKYANSADTLANISDINAEISKYDIAAFDRDRLGEFIRHSMESGYQSLVGGTIDTIELIKEYRAGKEVTVYDELGNAVVTYTRDEYDPDNYWRQLGDELLEKSQKNLEKAKSNRGVVGGLFADALKSNVEMLPDLALMMATGGASKFATLALTTASIAMRTLGAEDYALRQEYGDKISVSDRLLIAGLKTGVEALTEAVFEIIPGKAAGLIDPQQLIAGAALQVSNPFVAGSLLMAGSMAGEATEELIGGILSPIVEAIKLSQVEGKNFSEELSNIYSSPEHWAEVGRSMLVAALAVGIMPSTHHEAGKTTKARNSTAASAESGFSTLKSNNISAENLREMLVDPNNSAQKAAEKIRNGRSDEEISEKELELIKRLESAEPITEEVANIIVDGYREYLKTDKTASAILRMCSKLYGGDFQVAADALLVQDIAIANNPSINSMTDIGTRVTEDASVNEHYGVSKDGAAVDPNAKRAPAMRPAEQALASEAQAQAEISQAETAPAITEDQAQAEYAQAEDIQTETTPVENRELIDTANSIAERAPTEAEAQAEIASIEEVNPDADLGIDNKNDIEENAKVHKMTQEEFNYIQKNDAETFEIISKIQDSAKNNESIKLNSETKEKLANVGIEVVLGLGKSRVEFNVKNNSKLANVNARTDVKVQEQSKADNNLGITRNVAETATVSTKANTNTEILARGLTYEADTIASMNAVENKTATVEQARDAIAAADRAIRLSNFELSTASIDISNMSNAEISARQQHIDELNNIISSAEAIKAQAEQIIKESEEKQNDLRNSEGQNGETGNAESRESAEAGQNAETVEQREWSEKEYQSKKKEIRNIELALKQFFGKKNSEVRAKYEKAFVKAIYDITKGDVKNLRIVNKAPGDVIGVYDNNTDITHISLNKNQTAGEFLRTLAHEQTHKDISHLSPEEYSRALNDVRKALVDLGPDIDDVILTLTEGYFRRYGTTSAKMEEDIYLDTEIKNEEGLAWIYEEILTHSVEYQFPEGIAFRILDSIKGNIRNEIISNVENMVESMYNIGDKRFINFNFPKKTSDIKANTGHKNVQNVGSGGVKAKIETETNENRIETDYQGYTDFIAVIDKIRNKTETNEQELNERKYKDLLITLNVKEVDVQELNNLDTALNEKKINNQDLDDLITALNKLKYKPKIPEYDFYKFLDEKINEYIRSYVSKRDFSALIKYILNETPNTNVKYLNNLSSIPKRSEYSAQRLASYYDRDSDTIYIATAHKTENPKTEAEVIKEIARQKFIADYSKLSDEEKIEFLKESIKPIKTSKAGIEKTIELAIKSGALNRLFHMNGRTPIINKFGENHVMSEKEKSTIEITNPELYGYITNAENGIRNRLNGPIVDYYHPDSVGDNASEEKKYQDSRLADILKIDKKDFKEYQEITSWINSRFIPYKDKKLLTEERKAFAKKIDDKLNSLTLEDAKRLVDQKKRGHIELSEEEVEIINNLINDPEHKNTPEQIIRRMLLMEFDRKELRGIFQKEFEMNTFDYVASLPMVTYYHFKNNKERLNYLDRLANTKTMFEYGSNFDDSISGTTLEYKYSGPQMYRYRSKNNELLYRFNPNINITGWNEVLHSQRFTQDIDVLRKLKEQGISVDSDRTIRIDNNSKYSLESKDMYKYLDELFAGEIDVKPGTYEESVILELVSNAMVGNVSNDNIKLGRTFEIALRDKPLHDTYYRNGMLMVDKKEYLDEVHDEDIYIDVYKRRHESEIRYFLYKMISSYKKYSNSEEDSFEYDENSEEDSFEYDENSEEEYEDYFEDEKNEYEYDSHIVEKGKEGDRQKYLNDYFSEDNMDGNYNPYSIEATLRKSYTDSQDPELLNVDTHRDPVAKEVLPKVERENEKKKDLKEFFGNTLNLTKNIQNIVYETGCAVFCDDVGNVIEITQNKIRTSRSGDFKLTYDVNVYGINGKKTTIDDRAISSVIKSSRIYASSLLSHGTFNLAAKLRAAERFMHVEYLERFIGPVNSEETNKQIISFSESFKESIENGETPDASLAGLNTMKCKIDRDAYERETKNEIAESFADEESDYFDLPEVFSKEFNSPNTIYNAIPVEVTSENKDTVVAHDNVDNKDVTAFDVAVKSDEILGEALAANEEYKKALDTDILESYKIGNELIFDYFSNRGINAKDIAGIVNYASKNFADINSVATEENQASAEKKNMLDERYAGESKPVIFNLRAGEHRLVSEADCISSSIYSENGNLFHSAEDIRDCNIEDASGTYINGADSMSHHVIKQGEAVGKVDAELHRTDSSRKGRGWMKCLEKYRSFMANEVRSKAEAYDKSGSMKDYEALLNVLDEANSMYIQEHYENSRCKFFIDGFAMDNVGKPLGKVLQFLTSIQPDTRTLGIIDMLDGYNNGAHVKLLQQIYYASQLRVMEVLSHKEPVMKNAQELMDDFGFTDHEIQLFLDTQNLLGNKRFGEWGDWISLSEKEKEQFSDSLWAKKRFVIEQAKQRESIIDKKETIKMEFKNSEFADLYNGADFSTPQGRYEFFITYDMMFRHFVNEKASELNKNYQAMRFDEEEGYYLADVGYEEKFLDSYREYMSYLHDRFNEEAALTIGKQQGTGQSSFYTKMYWNHEDALNSKKNRNYTGGLSSRNLVMMRPLRENRGNSAETHEDGVDTLTVPSFTYTINEYSSYMAEAIGEGQFYQLFKSFQDNADNPYWKTLEGKIGKKNVEKIKNTFEYMSGVLEKESPNLLDRIFNTWQAGVLGGNLAPKGHKTGKLAYTTWMAQTFSTDTAEQIIGKAAIGRVEDTVTSYGSRLSRADVQKMVDNIKYSSLKALAQARLDGNMYEDFSMGSHDNLISLKDAATCALIMQEVCNRYSETEAGLKAVEAMDTQPNYDRISNGYYGYKRQSSPAWKLMLLFRNQRSTNMTRLLSAAAKYDVNKSQENLDNLVSTVKGVSHSTLKIALAKAIVNTLLRGWWTDGDDDDKKGEIEDFALFFAKNLLAQITAGIAGNGFWLNEGYNVCIFLLSGGFKNYYSKSEFNKDISDIFGGYASGMFPGFMSTAFNVATSAYNVIASMGDDKEFDFYNANNLACNVLQLFGVPASQLERVFMGALGASTTAYSLLGGNLPDSVKTNSFYKFAKALCTPNANTSELNMFIDSTSDSKSNAWDLLSSREQRKLTKDGFGKASYNIWAECNMEDVMSEEVYLNFVDSADVNGNGVVSKDEAEAFVLNNPEYEYVAGDYFKAKTAKHTSEGFVTSSGYTSKQEEYAERYNIPLEVFDKYDTDHNGEFSSEEKNAMPYDIQKAIGRSNISAANPETGMTDSEYAKWQKKGETWGLTTDAYIRIKALDKNGGGVSQDEMMQGIANGDVTVAEAWQYGLANGWSTKNMTKKFGKMPEGVSTTEQQRTISAVKPVELPNFNYNVDDLLIP